MLAPAALTDPSAQDKVTDKRVRCRQIAQDDLDGIAILLTRGFSSTGHEYWLKGFARLAALAPIEGIPRFGYVLESDGEIVGVLLTLASRRGMRILCNVSSWYVRHAFLANAAALVSLATRHKHVTYVNISPSPHTWRTLQAQGCKPYNFGRSAAFPVLGLGGGKVSETVPNDLPERELLLDHRGYGCISLVCEKDGLVSPFVFKRRRLDHPPLPMADLIYCRDITDFERCGAALGRWFLKRGVPGFLVDGKVSRMLSHYVAGKEPRYYKGASRPPLNDLAYTERVIFE